MFGVVPLICAKKCFITKQMQREGGGGRGGLGQNPNYDSARFTKECNINEIQRFARIPQTTRD